MQRSPLFTTFASVLLLILAASIAPQPLWARESKASAQFKRVRNDPPLLRHFLFEFPKGGDLHNHLDGAIYAENYIVWAAEDGKCIDNETFIVSPSPCNPVEGQTKLSDIQYNSTRINSIIDAFSIRNYERRSVSGHNQFFSTFRRFLGASFGREGMMLAEVTARAARQNIVYLELMQSYGMAEARELGNNSEHIEPSLSLADLVRDKDIDQLASSVIAMTDRVENQWHNQLSCEQQNADGGCNVPVRYLAQVIRVFPREQVLAQTLLAFQLMNRDPRYVGLNFVAPEDHPIALRDHKWQMELIRDLTEYFPADKINITLHAGELSMGLVPPEELGKHIREAIEIAGAKRIGHGVDALHDSDYKGLMDMMSAGEILVEINLTSNDVILGISDDAHPFRAYRRHEVPLALSTDDEGVSRIDLTHEYQRAVETYDLSYADLKDLSRNALSYSFLPGENLFAGPPNREYVPACTKAKPGKSFLPEHCKSLLTTSKKARLQWDLEKRFERFENMFR